MLTRPRRALPAIALAALLVLAGCAGLSAPDSQPEPETTVENFSYPPGWSQDGITDLNSAMTTHYDTVENTSRTTRLVITDDDGNRTIVRTVDVDAGTGSIQFSDTTLGSYRDAYYSSEGVFEYDPTTEEVERHPDENWTTADVAVTAGLERPLGSLELNATETVTVEGTTAVRYAVTGITDPDSVPSNDASGHVTVSEAGYVASYDVTRGNDEFTRQSEYRLSEFGTATVDRPPWLPE
ncbi:hypothetical protein [Halobacterium sp. CBA1126]|uniref:DUF7537 family lipoprotein n=1 Tax=Halobacterium sp. CBA1126 TaxID=2668074 RepID=UPI0012F8AE1B|nr:hypothetical protein [Halobacterium sp. CBA1126]MUV61390.1 hypothetical protein [Halobacterium sp. CBA1126]